MATNANIKDATTFPAPSEGSDHPISAVGRTVGNAKLLRFSDALDYRFTFVDDVGASRAVTADDAASWLWQQAVTFTKAAEREQAELAAANGISKPRVSQIEKALNRKCAEFMKNQGLNG